MKTVNKIITTLLVLSFIIILFGFFYDVLFAGIPYQDAPPSLETKYNENKKITSIIIESAFMVFVLIAAGRIGTFFIKKK